MQQTSDGAEAAASLAAADESQRARLLAELPADTLAEAITALGRTRTEEAARALRQMDEQLADKALRKAARRELHRLEAVGVHLPPPEPVAPAARPAADRQLPPTDVWATEIDPTGARAMWLLRDRELGGVWLAVAVLHDRQGLQNLEVVPSTRKRVMRQVESFRGDNQITWVTLPPEYAMELVKEAEDLTRASGGTLPQGSAQFREVFGEAGRAPERALVYETISPVGASFQADLWERGADLFEEREVQGWRVEVPEDVIEEAADAVRATTTTLAVPGRSPRELAERALHDAVERAFAPEGRAAFKRRLEETAYVFLQTDRAGAARLAVATAKALAESVIPLERQPFVQRLLEGSLLEGMADREVEGRPAAPVLADILRSVFEEPASPESAPRSASGLILPG